MSFSYEDCRLCGRSCGVDRTETLGYCQMSDKLFVARAALHMWEEPIISGTRGSGTVFFSGCSLRCVYCQNREISRAESGLEIGCERLAEIMLELQDKGAHNINLVTPTHYAPTIKRAVMLSREMGLEIPIVYNTSGYDSVDTVKTLARTVDVYLTDFKYKLSKTAKKYSDAPDYSAVAGAALNEMVKSTGKVVLDGNGLIKRGTVVRVLVLPMHVAEAKLIISSLYKQYGDDIYFSIMNQYTPMKGAERPLDRKVTADEYSEVVDYAVSLGIKHAFIQEAEAQSDSFIPPFDNTGVIKV